MCVTPQRPEEHHYKEGAGLKLNIWTKGTPEAPSPLGSFICGVSDSQRSEATSSK